MTSNRPRAALPTREIFDPFNSSGTGHQRAENRLSGSTSWRDSRTLKLRNQFISGGRGGKRVRDTVGGGSFAFDEAKRNGAPIPNSLGQKMATDQEKIDERLKVSKSAERPNKRLKTDDDTLPESRSELKTPFTKAARSKVNDQSIHLCSPSDLLSPMASSDLTPQPSPLEQTEVQADLADEDIGDQLPPQIFANVNVYINGSTAPLVSDHKLKHLLSIHGGLTSIILGRKSVTHVIIGRLSSNGGSGGGLSGTKIQKEIGSKKRAIHFVTADWVLESVNAGKRLPESKFEAMRIAPSGVGGIASMLNKAGGG